MTVIKKIPKESSDYPESSRYVVGKVSEIISNAINNGGNRIIIQTNLKRGLPLENINKVAGPFVEAWAFEKFEEIAETGSNRYDLIHVTAGKRLDIFDVVLQFKRRNDSESYISANVDVKATSEDIKNSGKSPNITSYVRIRSEYLDDPDYLFLILSLRHRVFCERNSNTGMTSGVMEVISHNVYDLKYLSSADIGYNPALGTGQLQVRDIHYVTEEKRNVGEFLQLLDRKYIRSHGETDWLDLARKHEWIKED